MLLRRSESAQLACKHVSLVSPSPSDPLYTFWVHLTAAAAVAARKVLAMTAAMGDRKGQDPCILPQTTCWPYDLLVDHFTHILE